MLVSNFAAATARSAYRLQVTNLSDQDLVFCVTAHANLPAAQAVNDDPRQYVTNSLGVHWGAQFGVQTVGYLTEAGAHTQANSALARVAAGVTGTVGVGKAMHGRRADHVTLSGYVTLSVPVWRATRGNGDLSAQAHDPVRVLLDASQQEGHGEDVPDSASASWTRAVPLADGRALVEIEPDSVFRTDVDRKQKAAVGLENDDWLGALLIPPPQRGTALLDLLAAVAADDDQLATVNELLADRRMDLRLDRR